MKIALAGMLVGLVALARAMSADDSPVSKAAMLDILDCSAAGDHAGSTRALEALDGADGARPDQLVVRARQGYGG